jgi:hypothetical protein
MVGAMLAVALSAAAASAQVDSPRRLSFAAGIDAAPVGPGGYRPGVFAQGGLQWRRPASRLGALVNLTVYDWRRERSYAGSIGCKGWCRDARRSSIAGVLVEGTLDLSRGGFRPYLLAGGGLFALSTSTRSNFRCGVVPPAGGGPRCVTLAEGTARIGDVRALPALTTGLGAELPAGRARVFAEARLFMTGDQNIGDRGSALLPVMVGVRF